MVVYRLCKDVKNPHVKNNVYTNTCSDSKELYCTTAKCVDAWKDMMKKETNIDLKVVEFELPDHMLVESFWEGGIEYEEVRYKASDVIDTCIHEDGIKPLCKCRNE